MRCQSGDVRAVCQRVMLKAAAKELCMWIRAQFFAALFHVTALRKPTRAGDNIHASICCLNTSWTCICVLVPSIMAAGSFHSTSNNSEQPSSVCFAENKDPIAQCSSLHASVIFDCPSCE